MKFIWQRPDTMAASQSTSYTVERTGLSGEHKTKSKAGGRYTKHQVMGHSLNRRGFRVPSVEDRYPNSPSISVATVKRQR